jgi:hypothetical protein
MAGNQYRKWRNVENKLMKNIENVINFRSWRENENMAKGVSKRNGNESY